METSPPLPNAYWVLPGRLLAGEHPSGADPSETRDRLRRLRESGIGSFLDLTELEEMPDYQPLLPVEAGYLRAPIVDTCVPRDLSQMHSIQAHIRGTLERPGGLYVHCRAGIGRTGLVIGCFLAESGLKGKAALKELNRLWRQSGRSKSWPKVPQTAQQADYILRWTKTPGGAPHR